MENREKSLPLLEKGKAKTAEQIAEEKYIKELERQYEQILRGFSPENRSEKARLITETFQNLSQRLGAQEGFTFGAVRKEVLKIKLARHFQHKESIDTNSLSDAIIETPNFLNDDKKGSLKNFLEAHKQKTLLKIAEMQKQRAETTGKKGLNPYEALFTTKGGKDKYYLTRLTKKSHLQEESEHMKHCVGTSNSYFNKIKQGTREIFSLRGVKDDKPALTIEYNVKTGIIEQIKKKNDEHLSPTDPLLGDALDALKQLRYTKNDQGKIREIKKINDSELENFKVKPEHILTDKGEIHFRDIDPKDNPLVIRSGEMEFTDKITHADAGKLLQIFEHLEFGPEQIARQPNEINKNTKAHVGKLEPGIFDKIQQYNIEHIYTTFPEGRVMIEKDFKAKPALLGEFEIEMEKCNSRNKSREIRLANKALDMIHSKDFDTLKNPEQMSLVRLKVGDLGFRHDATTGEIYRHAQELGLELCPPEVGPQYRLKYDNQPEGERLHIAMKPIYHEVFSLTRGEDLLYLSSSALVEELGHHPLNKFVFCLRPRLPK